jgi:hypothetical protein
VPVGLCSFKGGDVQQGMLDISRYAEHVLYQAHCLVTWLLQITRTHCSTSEVVLFAGLVLLHLRK